MSDARMASVTVQFQWAGEPNVCGDFTHGQLVPLHRDEGLGVWRVALQVRLVWIEGWSGTRSNKKGNFLLVIASSSLQYFR